MVQAEVACWRPKTKSIQAACSGQVYPEMHNGPGIPLEAIKRNICV